MSKIFEIKYDWDSKGEKGEETYIPAFARGSEEIFYIKADEIEQALFAAKERIPEQYQFYRELIIEITSVTKVGELLEA